MPVYTQYSLFTWNSLVSLGLFLLSSLVCRRGTIGALMNPWKFIDLFTATATVIIMMLMVIMAIINLTLLSLPRTVTGLRLISACRLEISSNRN